MTRQIRLLALVLTLLLPASAAISSTYGDGMTGYDARYGAAVGASAHWAPAYAPASRYSAGVGFGGNVALSCSGIDFQGFLKAFNPVELLTEMKNTLINGAQAAVASYLIMLAYSNPTLASVLDMLDKKYTARFDGFAQACNAQQARRRGEEMGAKRMADAEDQCFAQQVAKGSSPTEAYRVCANIQTFGSFDLPALKQTSEFLRRYTSLNMTNEMNGLLKLLPDEEITDGGMRMRPPALTTMQMYGNIENRSRNAIRSILDGKDPASIPECKEGDIVGSNGNDVACLPGTAANIVNSPAFLSARLLSPPAAEMYTSAMSSQIATTAMHSNIYELRQQVAQMDVKDSSGAGAEEVVRRRESLLRSIDRVEKEADALRKVQEARSKLARTQILTLQKTQEELAVRASAANSRPDSGTFSSRLTRLFN